MSRKSKPPYPRRDRNERGATRPHAIHDENPAGAKLLRRWYKAQTGMKVAYKDLP